MNKLLIALVIAASFTLSISAQKPAPPTKASTDTANQPDPKWRERYENNVYTVLLGSIFYSEWIIPHFGNGAFDSSGDGHHWMCYRRRSIGSADFERLSGNPKVSTEVIEDLQAINKTPADLSEAYGVKAAVQSISGGPDLEKLFSLAKKRYPKTNALVGLSRVGFNADRSLGLVYIEYYSEKTKLRKLYCLVPIKSYRVPGASEDNIEIHGEKIEIVEF